MKVECHLLLSSSSSIRRDGRIPTDTIIEYAHTHTQCGRTILCVRNSCVRYARTYCYAIYRSNLFWSFVRHDAFDKFFGESLTQYRNGFLAFYIIEYSKIKLKNEKKLRFLFFDSFGLIFISSLAVLGHLWLVCVCGCVVCTIVWCGLDSVMPFSGNCMRIDQKTKRQRPTGRFNYEIFWIESAERTNWHSETWNQWFTQVAWNPWALNVYFDNGSFFQ